MHDVSMLAFTMLVFGALLPISKSLSSITNAVDRSSSLMERNIKYIHGRRCQIIRNPKSVVNTSNNKSNDLNQNNQQQRIIPLVLIGGTAQSIGSWEHQIFSLLREKDNILVYECMGQGPSSDIIEEESNLKNYYKNVSLEVQSDNFFKVIKTVYPKTDNIDVAGFSFGGRVALAIASKYPYLIRKLHVTGVAAHRDNYGNIILASWRDIFSSNFKDTKNPTIDEKQSLLKAFAWSSILSCYSSNFLSRDDVGIKRINDWVKFICDNNTFEGLAAILYQTHYTDNNPWHTASIAERIAAVAKSKSSNNNIRLLVGENDILATPNEVQNLANILSSKENDNDKKTAVCVIPNSGHAVPIEQPRLWRNDLLSFLRD